MMSNGDSADITKQVLMFASACGPACIFIYGCVKVYILGYPKFFTSQGSSTFNIDYDELLIPTMDSDKTVELSETFKVPSTSRNSRYSRKSNLPENSATIN